MTLKEAKKILKKEGFCLVGTSEPSAIDEAFTEFESPEICEAMQIINSAGYGIMMLNDAFNARKARLKEEYAKNTKTPGPGEEQSKEGNPALKEAATQFNDALLDEQAKKIARLKKIIHKKNMKIEELRKERSIHLRGKVKLFGETVDLSQELCNKNEELRLSKIREKNLTEVCQKYMKENEKLKKKLADKVVDKIDAQVLKSAESALAEKDEVIADLGKELKAQKALADHISKKYDGAKINLKVRTEGLERLKKELEEKTKLVDIIRNASKEYCDYGVAANEFIKKLASLYVLANNNGTINVEMLERCKNYQSYGFPANCNRETKKEINDIVSGKTKTVGVDVAEEGGDQSATIVQCGNGITFSKEEAKIIERCTKNGTELHYSEKYGLTYTNVFGEELPVICLRGMFYMYTDEEIKNMKK